MGKARSSPKPSIPAVTSKEKSRRGRQGGRPKGLSKEALAKAQAAKTLYLQQDKTVAEIGQLLGVGRATIYRYLEVPTGSGQPAKR